MNLGKITSFAAAAMLFPAVPVLAQETKRHLEEDKSALPAYIERVPQLQAGIVTPPSSAVRTMAEWEEIEALIVTYTSYRSIVRQIIKHARLECEVFVVCADSNQVKGDLTNDGIPLSNIRYFELPYNTVWVRDYGPWTIYKADVDSIFQVDWIYNRPRPRDDTIPNAISSYLNYPLYQTTNAPFDLMNTGGNFMTDGLGTGFSSELVLHENDGNGSYPITYPTHTEAEIDTMMKQFMGIDRYIKMTVLPYDGIHHIDMHMKLLDEETLLVGEYPAGIADGPQIEANLNYVLNNFNSAFGTPYKVIRIPQPPENGQYPHQGADYRTYANAVFVNKTILVPTYQEQYDTTGLRIWREAMPGYNIQGINCNQIIPAGGAIHCITKAIGSSDPLLIAHGRPESVHVGFTFPLVATIKHISGIDSAFLWFRSDTTGAYNRFPMTSLGNNQWSASLTFPTPNTLQYYFEAHATSGKTQVRPLVAPDGYYEVDILPIAIGINDDKSQLAIGNPYPQPGRDRITIPLSLDNPMPLRVWMLDASGKHVQDILSDQLSAGQHRVVIKGSRLDAGLYMVVFETNGQRKVVRVIVQ